MGSRARIAAAGSLVAFGLWVGGASDTAAHAAPAPDSVGVDEGDTSRTDSSQKDGTNSGPRVGARDGITTDAESRGEKPEGRKPGERRPGGGRPGDRKPDDERPDDDGPAEGDPDAGEGPATPPRVRDWPAAAAPPGEEEPEDCLPWWPPEPGPEADSPPTQSGGGGGVGTPNRPVRHPRVPQMQLPPHVLPEHAPSEPGVIDAEPGVGSASEIPLAPITLPIIVAPPVSLPGGAAPRSLPTEPVPGSPRGSAADPPIGRQPPPAETGSHVSVPAASYRAGYTDYLRSAGISQIAALAAPGLAGMLMLTGLGGLVGYRQARAGHAVRTGGAARFLN